jgi:3'-5' exoribonuclease
MKRIYVKDLFEGLNVEDIFCVTSKSVANARNGSRYIRLRLEDRTGSIAAVKWNATEDEIRSFSERDIIRVRGTANVYQNELQLTLDYCRKYEHRIDPADFVGVSKRAPEEMLSDLKVILRMVKRPDLSRLLAAFFDDENFVRKFIQAPAAKSVHHAWIGGLVEHTLNVVRTCAAIADIYPHIDRDIIITAAALHDIGKIDEYNVSIGIDLSDAGHLVGHIVLGAMMVKEAADRIDGFDRLTSLALQHAILAHHGTHEWGSPKRPKSVEAFALHLADDLDAKVDMFCRAIEESDDNGEDTLFTRRHFHLDRPIFKGTNRQNQQAEQLDSEDPELDLFVVDTDWDPFADE